jgi:hypothetical protein
MSVFILEYMLFMWRELLSALNIHHNGYPSLEHSPNSEDELSPCWQLSV